MKRKCGTCTKCCEGYLVGEIKGKAFFKGSPCHFLEINKGCTIYPERPQHPCASYKCAWLIDESFPMWFKPNEINTIIDYRIIDNIEYINVIEAGSRLDSNVLSWLIIYAQKNNMNIRWTADSGPYWIGTKEFCEAMEKLKLT